MLLSVMICRCQGEGFGQKSYVIGRLIIFMGFRTLSKKQFSSLPKADVYTSGGTFWAKNFGIKLEPSNFFQLFNKIFWLMFPKLIFCVSRGAFWRNKNSYKKSITLDFSSDFELNILGWSPANCSYFVQRNILRENLFGILYSFVVLNFVQTTFGWCSQKCFVRVQREF